MPNFETVSEAQERVRVSDLREGDLICIGDGSGGDDDVRVLGIEFVPVAIPGVDFWAIIQVRYQDETVAGIDFAGDVIVPRYVDSRL